jgi:hypothetical protein
MSDALPEQVFFQPVPRTGKDIGRGAGECGRLKTKSGNGHSSGASVRVRPARTAPVEMSDSLQPVAEYMQRRPAAALLAGLSAATFSLWVAICTAAPEFIWRGLRIATGHIERADLYSALLVGVILAFFVEPLMERLRGLGGHAQPHAGRGVLFTAAIGLVFAFVAVCLHDAMKAFLAAQDQHAGPGTVLPKSGLMGGLFLTVGWAMVPFATSLAWFGARRRWLAAPLGLAAALSAYGAGSLFAWSRVEIVTTMVPCVAILLLGYRQTPGADSADPRSRQARLVAQVAGAWLLAALLLELILDAVHLKRFALYSPGGIWMDFRFYLGWVLGLLLAPSPAAYRWTVVPRPVGAGRECRIARTRVWPVRPALPERDEAAVTRSPHDSRGPGRSPARHPSGAADDG